MREGPGTLRRGLEREAGVSDVPAWLRDAITPTGATFGPFSPKVEAQRETGGRAMLVAGRMLSSYCCDPSCLECVCGGSIH